MRNPAAESAARGVCVLALTLAALLSLPGCEAHIADGNSDVGREPVSYPEVAARYNERLIDLARLQAPVSVVLESVKEDGSRSRDQLEGSLLIEVPRRVALRLDKTGQNAAYLGSNDRLYWWMALAERPRWAAVGTHLQAEPDDAAEFGLPVHPLEFIELLGVLRLPESTPQGAEAVRTKDGRSLVLTLPSRWGVRRLTLDADTYRPRRIELLDASGEIVASADLTRYVIVSVEGRPGAGASVASNVSLAVPQGRSRIILVVSDPRAPLSLNSRAFNIVELVKAYDIDKLYDLDRGERPGPIGKSGP
ncbi:MAG: hypothetical protein JNK25_04155 [Phycisphaerae bacterium]|nr:hypothetical protein [Phycisphaerae bacterium]